MSCCLYCGKPVSRAGAKYCSYRCAGLARQHYNVCVICGKEFPCPPADQKQTCSRTCATELRRRQAIEYGHAARIQKEQAKLVANTPPDKWPTAKGWVIRSPEGKTYECVNLIQFFREHADIIDGTPKQAASGMITVKSSMQGTRKRNRIMHWKGWTLISWDDRHVAPRGSKK